ncbi:MAG: arsenate reductase ArsC [Acidobacteriota bacterium]
MSAKPGLLVLCTGNSARSQMAASFFRHYAGDRFHVLSAGTEPAERVHPLTVAVMQEKGIDLSSTRPVDYRDLLDGGAVHTLVIVCDGASKSCPSVWPGCEERLMWPFDDPAAYEGSDAEKLAEFRRIRDQIEAKIRAWA